MRSVILRKLPAEARRKIEQALRGSSPGQSAAEPEEERPPDSEEARHFAETLPRGTRAYGRIQEVAAAANPCARCGADTTETMVIIGHGDLSRVCLACAPREFEERGASE